MGPIQITTRVIFLTGNNLGMTFASSNDRRCWIDKDWSIHIDPSMEGDRFPVYLQFESNLPITAVGFSEDNSLREFTKKGPCGGPFFLECDIDPTSTTTPLIRNDGPAKLPPGILQPDSFHFMLWFENGKNPVGIDPQIYNLGDTETPPEPDRKRGGWLARLLRKLLDWLER